VLVDLAGSEQVKKSGADDIGLKEAQHIHASFSALGTVVQAITSHSKDVPFRDSKLTRLMRGAFLSPVARILLIATLSPASSNYHESLSTLQFANRLKYMKDGNSVSDTAEDTLEDYETRSRHVDMLKAFESLCADVRMARCMRTPEGPGPCDTLLPTILLSLRKELLDGRASSLQALEDETMSAMAEFHTLSADIKDLETAFKEREERSMKEAKRAKKARKAAEEDIKRLMVTLSEAPADENAFQTEETLMATTSEADHASIMSFSSVLLSLRQQQLQLFETKTQCYVIDRQLRSVSLDAEELKFLADLTYYLVERSVDISRKDLHPQESFSLVDIIDCRCALVSSGSFLRPLTLERHYAHLPPRASVGPQNTSWDSEEETEIDDVTVSSPSSRDLASNTVDKVICTSNNLTPPVTPMKPSSATTPEDVEASNAIRKVTREIASEEAEKKYLMRVYDSPTLVEDLITYLSNGTTWTKYSHKGVPIVRKAWLAPRERKIISKSVGQRKEEIKSVALADIKGIVLGPYSKVFTRRENLIEPASTQFHLAFTLELNSLLGKKTVDVVAASIVDFEAWVISLSNLCQKEPQWGKPMLEVSQDSKYAKLASSAQSYCALHHLPPKFYVCMKEIIAKMRDDLTMNMRIFNNDLQQMYEVMGGIHPPALRGTALWFTKGEMRFYADIYGMDIFRVCALWRALEEEKLVYDDKFREPFFVKAKEKR